MRLLILSLILIASKLSAFELRQIEFVAFNKEAGAILARLPRGPIVQLEFASGSDEKAVDRLNRLLKIWYMSERNMNNEVRAFDVNLSFVVSFDEERMKTVPMNYIPVRFPVVLRDWQIGLPFELSLLDSDEREPLQGVVFVAVTDPHIAFGKIFTNDELSRHVYIDKVKVSKIESQVEGWRKHGMKTKILATEETLKILSQQNER